MDWKKWYLGYVLVIDITEGMCTVEYLDRVGEEVESGGTQSDPIKEDVCEVDATEVVSIQPEYEWDIMNIKV